MTNETENICIRRKKEILKELDADIEDERKANIDYRVLGDVLSKDIKFDSNASGMSNNILTQLSTDEGKHHKALQELRDLISAMSECRE